MTYDLLEMEARKERIWQLLDEAEYVIQNFWNRRGNQCGDRTEGIGRLERATKAVKADLESL
jgi:hypothetical protein